MENKDLMIDIDSLNLNNLENTAVREIGEKIIQRNKKLQICDDYYKGGGKQWQVKGQITASGYQIVDKLTHDRMSPAMPTILEEIQNILDEGDSNE